MRVVQGRKGPIAHGIERQARCTSRSRSFLMIISVTLRNLRLTLGFPSSPPNVPPFNTSLYHVSHTDIHLTLECHPPSPFLPLPRANAPRQPPHSTLPPTSQMLKQPEVVLSLAMPVGQIPQLDTPGPVLHVGVYGLGVFNVIVASDPMLS